MINKKKYNKSVFLAFGVTMSRYFIELSFKGTRYHGWQSQPNAFSVQSVIENSLKVLFRQDMKLTGAGRTDTGVHACFYVAHFDTENSLAERSKDFVYKMNALLPQDVSVLNIYKVNPEAHARFSALSRTYQYCITQVKNPFLTDFAWYYSIPLNIEAMNECTRILFEYSDFTSFSKLHSDTKTNDCQIFNACWQIQENGLLFVITANRFLRNMVRSIVGTMVDAGRNKITPEDFRNIIDARNRCEAGLSAPAHGLSLKHIQYADNIRM